MGSDWTVAPLKKIDREARWIGIYPLHLWPTLRCRNHRQCRLPWRPIRDQANTWVLPRLLVCSSPKLDSIIFHSWIIPIDQKRCHLNTFRSSCMRLDFHEPINLPNFNMNDKKERNCWAATSLEYRVLSSRIKDRNFPLLLIIDSRNRLRSSRTCAYAGFTRFDKEWIQDNSRIVMINTKMRRLQLCFESNHTYRMNMFWEPAHSDHASDQPA